MPRDPRVKHLQRLHHQRRLRAAGHFSADIPQRLQPHDAGRILLALLLLSIILGTLLALPSLGDVPAWVHQVTHSLPVDRVGMLAPTDAW
jgi:hypothetical protein